MHLQWIPGAHSSSWAEAPVKIARMTLTIKLDGNWNSFQLANNTPPLSVTGSVIAPSARMARCGMATNKFHVHKRTLMLQQTPNELLRLSAVAQYDLPGLGNPAP